jgi:hypothetical protein
MTNHSSRIWFFPFGVIKDSISKTLLSSDSHSHHHLEEKGVKMYVRPAHLDEHVDQVINDQTFFHDLSLVLYSLLSFNCQDVLDVTYLKITKDTKWSLIPDKRIPFFSFISCHSKSLRVHERFSFECYLNPSHKNWLHHCDFVRSFPSNILFWEN